MNDILGYCFKDPSLLVTALTHPSATGDETLGQRSNQRMEFLGDAVLQLVLSEALYARFPRAEEGAMTKARARLVNQRALAEQANRLKLGEMLRLGRGEEQHGGRRRPSALADAFEAVIGAIFLDAGYEAAQMVVLKLFEEAINQFGDKPGEINPKGELQEVLQAQFNESPVYGVVSVSGPDHDRVFESSVMHQGIELGRGVGKTKKEAEFMAALAALKQMALASEPRLSPEGTSSWNTQNPASPEADDFGDDGPA